MTYNFCGQFVNELDLVSQAGEMFYTFRLSIILNKESMHHAPNVSQFLTTVQ